MAASERPLVYMNINAVARKAKTYQGQGGGREGKRLAAAGECDQPRGVVKYQSVL